MEKVRIFRNTAKLNENDVFFFDTRAEGPVILCLHGRFGRAETWYEFIQHYGGEYRIIAPDQRGHGLSSKPESEYTAEEMAGDMIELLDFLQLKPVILLGHSMGGRIAGYVAALYPDYVSALAILDRSASGISGQGITDKEQITDTDYFTKNWPLPFDSLGGAKAFIRSAAGSELSYEYFMNSLQETQEGYKLMYSAQAMAAGISHDVDWFHLLPRIKCPVLLLRAKGGEAVADEDFTRMQSLLADCIVREISHPDHNVHLGNKDEFYGYVDELLRRLKAAE